MSVLKQILYFSLLPVSLLSLLLFLLLPTNHHQDHQYSSFTRLSDGQFPPPPRIAYFIAGSNNDGPRIFRLLQAIYHPRNYYLLHLDQLASQQQRLQLAEMVASVHVFVAAENVNVVNKADWVNPEGSSPLALVLRGAAVLLKWQKDWDWFVNLDPFDYPLIPQDDFLHIMSFIPKDFNFIEHKSNFSVEEYQRITDVVVDPRLYLQSKGRMFVGSKKRALPTAFVLSTGSPHVILSRKLIEYSILGYDNLPRMLLLYFSNSRFPHRGYFQTLACNLKEFSDTVINSNLHYAHWDDSHVGSQNTNSNDLQKMLSSGAAFAGNLSRDDPILDKIDSLVLHRYSGSVSPGGWCIDKPRWGRNLCLHLGDPDILRPSPAAKRFEQFMLRLMANLTYHSKPLHTD